LVSLLALVPFLVTLLTCVAAALYALKRKVLAQSICIQQAAQMQRDLSGPLQKLLHLNAKAASLRAARAKADVAVQTAEASGLVPAIAAAKAVETAVILRQTALRGQQLALLAEAQRIRDQGQRDLRLNAGKIGASHMDSRVYYYRPLAVQPRPPESLTPNYEPVPFFEQAQQHRFRFDVDLLGNFPTYMELNTVQATECAVTLERKDEKWDIRILAAKAR
jgi:hypothetical protein